VILKLEYEAPTPSQSCKYRLFTIRINHLDTTHAHCSILASACSIVTLLFKLPPFPLRATFVGSTTTMPSSLGGVSGGMGAPLCRPIDLSFPVRNNSTAWRVLSTLREALGVFRTRLLHSSRVVGAGSGTRGRSALLNSELTWSFGGTCCPADASAKAAVPGQAVPEAVRHS
jgi:hypothetical protein